MATCRLRDPVSTATSNISPQETREQDSGTVGVDGAGLSCPGSSVVAKKMIEGEGPIDALPGIEKGA